MVTLVTCHWETTPDIRQLLSHGPDVVRFKATAASDEPDSKLVRLASPPSRFPTSDLSGFNAEGKLRDLDPTKAASVRHPVTQGLGHQIGPHLDGPLHFQDVAEVLADDQVHLVQDQHLKGLS